MTTLRFGPFVLNTATSELGRDGDVVAIEPQSLRLLELLIANRDRVVSRSDLVDEIWYGRAVSDWAISGAIKALRAALGDIDGEKRYVRTVHSRGYRFIAGVTTDAADEAARDKVPTLLVRIFRTSGSEWGLDYLAEGLSDDLITSLSRHPNWRVLSYNTSRALADTKPLPSHGVTAIIDGSIRQIGETIRINVATLDGAGDHQSWAETFDLTQSSLLAGHDMISDRLVAILSPGALVSPGQQRGTRNSEAYAAYQKGRYAYFRYEPKAFAEALGHFTRATELDPGFANAFAQQAYCRTTLYVFGLPGADTTLAPAEGLARHAIATDDASALPYARLGWVLGYDGKPDNAIAAFEAALMRDPDNAEVYHAYGETMNRLADPDRAAPLLDQVFSKDSYFPPSWEFPQGHTCLLQGQHVRAIAHFRSVLDRIEGFIPARVQLTRALWEIGEKDGATETVRSIKDLAPKYSLAHASRMFPYPVESQKARLIEALSRAGMQ